ncbi:C-Maf-inducing protein-like isoform X2 [Bacillus rossius redtenbacheri]|uniref:C-Maf-inducing protein-like isoform X2 n=1 Tax=Bacillus rossius redtenbacheri TaxID=93214 RepID=UPI002FDD3AC0
MFCFAKPAGEGAATPEEAPPGRWKGRARPKGRADQGRTNNCREPRGDAGGATPAFLAAAARVNSHGGSSGDSSPSTSSAGTSRQGSVESDSPSCSSQSSASCSSSSMAVPPAPQGALAGAPPQSAGPRFKLLREGDVQVCYLNHTRTVISKILSSKFLRRWETHHLYLNDSCISSKTPNGFLEMSVPYSSMEEVYVVTRWDVGHKFCIRLVVPDGSLLLQANNAYVRDQWYHSILWKKNIFKFRNILNRPTRQDVILKEMKGLIDFATSTPLQDECVTSVPIEIVSKLLADWWGSLAASSDVIATVAPQLENTPPSPDMCRFFCRHCVAHPRSPVVADELTPIVHRILKHNVDFGKSPHMRRFVQEYIRALHCQNCGSEVLKKFVASAHGPVSGCPHPRVLPNLVSVCLASVFSNFEERRSLSRRNEAPGPEDEGDAETPEDRHLQCYIAVFLHISEYEDWRPGLAQLLQPIPFPDEALTYPLFMESFMPVIQRIGMDFRCEVHQMVLGIRDGKAGWFDIYCPSSFACSDNGQLWCLMLQTLLACCCRRKRFLAQVAKHYNPCILASLRGHEVAHEALCLMLEWELVEADELKMQIVTTLQTTASGREHYAALCQRQRHLRELQQKGGPRKLTLPIRSTDADITRLLSCGSFGNLECLSLAFTHVTSACAEQLIKLPTLRYLNLWSTQFGDAGCLMIAEHLHKLQVLNLCETPVSDKGISALSALTSLRKLNLNSTKLSAEAFESLRKTLPLVLEYDVRYTEAW